MRSLVAALMASLMVLSLASCAAEGANEPEPLPEEAVERIGAKEAHDLMTSDRIVVLDVRTREEYDASHIVNAKLLPLDEIDDATAAEAAPDKDELVLVYCRTGVRSAEASCKLAELGYSRVRDFGGIVDWPYVTVDAPDEAHGTVETDELPVGVKVVCGKTKPLPDEE